MLTNIIKFCDFNENNGSYFDRKHPHFYILLVFWAIFKFTMYIG